MRTRSLVASVLPVIVAPLAMLIGGCTPPSLHPLATPETTIADQGLIGSWSEDHGNATYVVSPTGDEKVYRLTIVPHNDDGAISEAELRIVKLGDGRYADLSPTKAQRDGAAKVEGKMFIPGHCIASVRRTGDSVVVRQLSSDWVKDALTGGGQTLAHALVDGDVIITAPTPELQAFVTRIAGVDKAWEKPVTLLRLKPAPERTEK